MKTQLRVYMLAVALVAATLVLYSSHAVDGRVLQSSMAWLQPAPPTIVTSRDPSVVYFGGKGLWNRVRKLYIDYPPPVDQLVWPGEWPTMPMWNTELRLDKEKLTAASPTLSPDEFEKARRQFSELRQALPQYDQLADMYSGRGYVMTAGGWFLNRCFPVGVMMLKQLGSRLPVEIWTKDDEEYEATDKVVRDLAREGIDIRTYKFSDILDPSELPKDYNTNYMMKALAVLFSTFEEVILLDADNVPVMLPDGLFDTTMYQEHGLMLWPDLWPNSLSATLHDLYDIPWQFERTCESGQMVIDKKRHLDSLVLANYFNWYGPEYFYKLITLDSMGSGDKDTFGVAALALGKSFHFTYTPLEMVKVWDGQGKERPEDEAAVRGAMGQRNPLDETQIMFMHTHDPKLNFQADKLSFDLQFVHETPKAVFSPDAESLEYKIWQSIRWVECESTALHVKEDPRQVCQGVKDRMSRMSPHRVSSNVAGAQASEGTAPDALTVTVVET